nr:hypothetical protein [Bacillota bacterium]
MSDELDRKNHNHNNPNNNDKNEIDDFLSKFDEIKKSFEMTERSRGGSVNKQVGTPSDLPAVSPRRAERLERLRSKNNDKNENAEISMPKKKKKTRKYRINVKRLLITLICLGILICGAVGVWA